MKVPSILQNTDLTKLGNDTTFLDQHFDRPDEMQERSVLASTDSATRVDETFLPIRHSFRENIRGTFYR